MQIFESLATTSHDTQIVLAACFQGIARGLHHRLVAGAVDGTDKMIADENTRYLLDLQVRAASQAKDQRVRSWCAELYALDPYCVDTRLLIGDAYTAIGDNAAAARWYARAGELGTGSGAVGWFRAAQCYDFLGDRGGALNAMGRCLELDAVPWKPRAYLESAAM